MRLKLQLILATALFAVYPAFAQDTPFSSMSVGIKVSTLGLGLEAATPLTEQLALRFGLNTTAGLGLKEYNIPIPDVNGDLFDSFGYIPELGAKPSLKFTHGNLLLDFHPAGSFHLTAGVFIGNSKIPLSGRLVDRNNETATLLPGKTWPKVEVGDQKIDMTGGRADNIDLKLGKSALKPYLGLGVGRAVPKRNLSFKFELGVLLQNGYSINNNGVALDLSASTESKVVDIHDALSSYIKVWPLLSFQLSYRIF